MRIDMLITAFVVLLALAPRAIAREPMPIAVAGLTHTHVHWLFESEKRGDVVIVGVAEKNRDLAERYFMQYGKPLELLYDDLKTMLDATKPVGVVAFGSIAEHLGVVEAAAPRGVHVMVEKPLAVSADHAARMAALARKHEIHLLTNYETTWYATTEKAGAVLAEGEIGALRKAVFRHGHRGPKAIGVNQEFLDWLTDPDENGAGALTDFGCYGANLMTWLMAGARPERVTAVTRQFQPDDYPKVDDDATIILDYENAQAVIQASWNWPVSRKDMSLYGTAGELHADTRADYRVQKGDDAAIEKATLDERAAPFDDPFAFFRAVIEGDIELSPHDPSALENNLRVVEILDAAKRSAASGEAVAVTPIE